VTAKRKKGEARQKAALPVGHEDVGVIMKKSFVIGLMSGKTAFFNCCWCSLIFCWFLLERVRRVLGNVVH
jgi:hypothetical protein